MKVLITGAAGQLGSTLVRTAPAGVAVVAADRGVLDITDEIALCRYVENVRPQRVVNAAAYTAVDRAESEPELAFATNARAAGVLARACRDCGATLIHISTDYVFDGASARPYAPDAAANPLNVYGRSKRQGEVEILSTPGLSRTIVRTGWVYAARGRNFLTTMLALFRKQSTVRVVADQIGTPTSAATLAQCLWQIATDGGDHPELLHFTDAGAASWYDFALAIHEEAERLGLIMKPVNVVPVTTEQYGSPVRRPLYSILDKAATWQALRLTPVHWRVALRRVLGEIEP
jgi:dTDP-4-dehydrorhamnose reductase